LLLTRNIQETANLCQGKWSCKILTIANLPLSWTRNNFIEQESQLPQTNCTSAFVVDPI